MPSIINGFIIFSLFVTITYFAGLITFINDHEENKCEMTYMFEYPQYVRISSKIDEKFPKYGLYSYSEGRVTEKTRNMYFDGIPVLFIPGNGGSHRQVRSLASISLRKAYNARTPFHFDYFSINFNEELSGLNGALLTEQISYVNHSIYRILQLYEKRQKPPTSIILFGHSMGGVIARHLALSLPQDSELVPIVLTLASPHKRPPLMLDQYSYDFYKGIESIQQKTSNTTFVSLSGGYSDFLVPSFVTSLDRKNKNNFNVVTTHVPLSWLPADHLCILWCKQTVLVVNRALFGSVDPKTRQISTDAANRRRVFRHHLLHHSGTKQHMREIYAIKANIRNEGEWIENFGRQYTLTLQNGVKQPHFYMIRLINQTQHESLTVVAINLETIDWAFACGAHIPRGTSRVCEEFKHLTQTSEILPSVKNKRRGLTVNLHELLKNDPDLSHVVLRLLPTDDPVIFHVDVYNNNARKQIVYLPFAFSFQRKIILEETAEKAILYEFVLPQLEFLVQSYHLYVDKIKCANQFHHATASLIVPWDNQNYHEHFTSADDKPMHVRLFSPKPNPNSNRSAKIRLTLDPSCRYRVSIKSNILGTFGQLARFYTPLLVANAAAVILMGLTSQLKSIATQKYCSIFFTAVKEGAKPYYILPFVKLLSRFLSLKPVTSIIPPPDWIVMAEEGSDFFLLPLILYLWGVGIVWLMGVVLCISLTAFETTIHKVALKFLARTVSFTVSWSDYVMSALHKLPCVVAGTLVSLSLLTTGSLALCVGMVFYFLRLTQLSQNYIEELVWSYLQKFAKEIKKETKSTEEPKTKVVTTHNAMFFHFTLFLLWSLLTIINIPSVLTWAHNFRYSTSLQPDPSFLPGFVLSVCAVPLWQLELPKVEKKFYFELSEIVRATAVLSLIYSPISIFRLNYTLTFVIVIVTLHQLVAKNREISSQPADTSSPYDEVKAKLE